MKSQYLLPEDSYLVYWHSEGSVEVLCAAAYVPGSSHRVHHYWVSIYIRHHNIHHEREIYCIGQYISRYSGIREWWNWEVRWEWIFSDRCVIPWVDAADSREKEVSLSREYTSQRNEARSYRTPRYREQYGESQILQSRGSGGWGGWGSYGFISVISHGSFGRNTDRWYS